MPSGCIVNGCINARANSRKSAAQIEMEKYKKISFHVFPVDAIARKRWVEIMKLDPSKIKRSSHLCSLHFEERFIDRTSLVNIRLRENALPSYGIQVAPSSIVAEAQPPSFTVMEVQSSSEEEIMELPEGFNDNDELEPGLSEEILQQNCTILVASKDAETSVSPDRIWNSPTKKRMRELSAMKDKEFRKKIKVLQQKVRRKSKQIVTLTENLNKLSEKKLHTLEGTNISDVGSGSSEDTFFSSHLQELSVSKRLEIYENKLCELFTRKKHDAQQINTLRRENQILKNKLEEMDDTLEFLKKIKGFV